MSLPDSVLGIGISRNWVYDPGVLDYVPMTQPLVDTDTLTVTIPGSVAVTNAGLSNLDITLSALRDALRGASSKTLTDIVTALASVAVTGPQTDAEARTLQSATGSISGDDQKTTLALNGAPGAMLMFSSASSVNFKVTIEQSPDGGTTWNRTGAYDSQNGLIHTQPDEVGFTNPGNSIWSIFVDGGATHVRTRSFTYVAGSINVRLEATYVPDSAIRAALGSNGRLSPRVGVQIGGSAALGGNFAPVVASTAEVGASVQALAVRNVQGLGTTASTVPAQANYVGGRDPSTNVLRPIDVENSDPAGTEYGAIVREIYGPAIAASLSVIDDWDESDRAKVNPIAGAVGVAGGSGVDATNVQRVSLATNVALPAGTNAIGKLSPNSGVDIGDVAITSIAAGDNNIGNVDVVTQPTYGGKTITYVAVAQGAAGTTVLATADAAKKHKLLGAVLTMSLVGTLKFTDGVADLTGAMDIATTGGFTLPTSLVPYTETGAINRALNLVTTLGAAKGVVAILTES